MTKPLPISFDALKLNILESGVLLSCGARTKSVGWCEEVSMGRVDCSCGVVNIKRVAPVWKKRMNLVCSE